jgi:hypothetical protein
MKMPSQNFNTHIFIFVFILIIAIPLTCKSKCLVGDCTNGTGTATLAGVKTFEGVFVNGKPAGSGIMTYSNGNIISGSFVGWNPVGKALLQCSNGSEYEIDLSGNNGLSSKMKKACTVVVPIEIDPEYEAEIQRQLDRVSISERNLQIATQDKAQRNSPPPPSIAYLPNESSRGSEYEQNMIDDIQVKIQKYKSSNMSVGNRAKFVSELEIEKSTIIAGSDSQQAIQNLESTHDYIKSLNISPGNERKLLDFVRKAKIVLLRRGVPNSTFPGFTY